MTTSPLLRDLTDAQRAAVEHGDGPLLVVAGPGSGKTRVITRRIAHLCTRGVRPGAILAITFTNKAAQEMARRVESLGAPPGAWVKTFHAACAAILRRWPDPAGLTSGFSIFDTQDQTRVLRGILRRREFENAGFKPAAVRARISKWKTGGSDPARALVDAAGFTERLAAEVYAAYEQELGQSNAVDFDDLLVRTLQVLETDADVRARLQQRFEHVLIDEYQDTSPVQFHLARLLAEPQENICATGDPDQSIYAFRNADVRNILEFEQHYPGAAVVRLEHNFRSVATVLRAADALIANNVERHLKTLVPTREEGRPLHIVGTADEDEEGLAIADAVLESYSRGTPYRDMAIFYRVNAQSRAIETALRVRGVPYMIVKGVEFYQRAEVKDLVAYLKVIANPSDRESMTRVLSTPKRGIGAKSLERIFAMAREHGWPARRALVGAADSGDLPKRATLGLRDVGQLLDRLERGATGSVGELVRDTAAFLRYEDVLRDTYPADYQERIENVRELIGGAEEYDRRLGIDASLPDFLHEVGLVSDSDQYDPDMPRVALMTLHSAKGLEFREVFLAGVEEGLLPHARSALDRKAVEEERRLLFVGITRAKDRLMLSYARDRRARIAGNVPGGASSFLTELPEDAMDVARATLLVRRDEPDDLEADGWGRGRWGGRGGGGAGRWGGGGGAQRRPGAASSWGAASRGRADPAAGAGIDPVVEYDGVDADPHASAAGRGAGAGDAGALHKGARVVHSTFGEGVVLRLMGAGTRQRAVIFFRGAGEKTLALSHAKLTVI